MRKVVLLIGLLLPAGFASASDINCRGKVTWVMDYPERCNGNTAFKTTGSNVKWICPPSDKGNALVLAALAADKEVEVYINSQNGVLDCNNMPDYSMARYVIINP
jgi:hypothetical protein